MLRMALWYNKILGACTLIRMLGSHFKIDFSFKHHEDDEDDEMSIIIVWQLCNVDMLSCLLLCWVYPSLGV